MNSVKRIVALVIAVLMVLGTFGSALYFLAMPAYAANTVTLGGSFRDWGDIRYKMIGENDYTLGSNLVNNSNLVYKIEGVILQLVPDSSIGFRSVKQITQITYGSGGSFYNENGDNKIKFTIDSESNNRVLLELENLRYDRATQNMNLRIYYRDERDGNREYIGNATIIAKFADPNPDYTGNGGSRDNSDDPLRVLTPRVIIDRYNKVAGVVKAEEQFTMNIHYVTPSELLLKNVMMEVQAPSGVSLLNSSNKVYIETISDVNPGSSNFTFVVSKDYTADTVPVTVNFDFEYWLNDDYVKGSSSEILSLPVVSKEDEETEDRFELSTLELPENLYVDEEGWLTLNVINKGKEQVSNVTVTLEGENVSNTGYSEYHGAVASNTKAEIELPIRMRVGGDSLCTLTVTYENKEEEIKTLTKEFSINAMEMDTGMNPGMWEDPGMMEDPAMAEPQGGFPWLWVGLGVVVVGTVGAIVAVKIIKKKKEQKLLEEDDEDN